MTISPSLLFVTKQLNFHGKSEPAGATFTPEQHQFHTMWPNVRCILNINDYHNYHMRRDEEEEEEDDDDEENDTLQQKLQNGLLNFGLTIDMFLDKVQQHITMAQNNIASSSATQAIDFNVIIGDLLLQQQQFKKQQ